jgi:FkbM family methyltransferase
VVTELLGFTMRLRPGECVDRHLLFCPQLYERAELHALKQRLTGGDVFLDAGANIGFYSLALSPIVGSLGRVIAVDADPDNCERIRQHIAMNSITNITAHNLGLADKPGTLRLGINTTGNRGGSSFLINGDDGVEVQCKTLLDFLQEERVDRVDAAKFDIEGFEFRVLRPFLESAPNQLLPRAIVIENNPYFAPRAGGDVLHLLRHHGFKVTSLKDCDFLAERRV